MIQTALTGPRKARPAPQKIALADDLILTRHGDGRVELAGARMQDGDFVQRVIQTLNALK